VLPYGSVLPEPTYDFLLANGPNVIISDTGKASVVVVKYNPQINGLPIYMGGPNDSCFYFRFTPGGKLLSYSIYDLSLVQKQDLSELMASTEEAVSRLRSGTGSIAAVYPKNKYGELYVPDFRFSAVNIIGAKLGYLAVPEGKKLIPAYLFDGTAINLNNNAVISVLIYVSALQ
jgi:hypothetical protein